ncbi:ANTAR domain-containing protein [Streptomyces sp. NPDC052109]|uniref:ANTAR domain-containing protein n=1 Tax=Streptomyces sp. NPDC052109 TaxID=3155527 RepID=UPI0034256231
MVFFTLSRRRPLVLLSSTELAAEYDRLVTENEQLRQAVSSHAVIDQAIGAVVVLGQIAPEEAWRALRDVSQRTNTKLRTVAEHILDYAQGGALPEPERIELGQAIDRYRRCARLDEGTTTDRGEPAGHGISGGPPSDGGAGAAWCGGPSEA